MNYNLSSMLRGIPDWAFWVGFALVALFVLAITMFLFVKIISKIQSMITGKDSSTEKNEKSDTKAKKKKKISEADSEQEANSPKDSKSGNAEENMESAEISSEKKDKHKTSLKEKIFGRKKHSAADSDSENKVSDAELMDSVDVLTEINKRGIQSEKKKKSDQAGKKPLSPRKSQKALKGKAAKLKVPKTVQQSIPYYAVYPSNGIIETEPGVFTKSYLLQDVNYQIAKDEEQAEMFSKFGQLLNSFEPSVRFEITINQKNINMDKFEEETMLLMKEDELDVYRIERNEIIKKKLLEGKNNLVKEKYLTVSASADTIEAAETLFARMDSEIHSSVKKIGQSDATVLTTVQRLEILHDIYNIGSEGLFGNNLVVTGETNGKKEFAFAEDKFSFEILNRMGLSTKDMIAPDFMSFKTDYGMVGDKYFRALFVRKLPAFLVDTVLKDLTDTECNMITSIHYQSIDGENAQKMVSNKIRNINAALIDKQKKAAKGNYSADLVSPELQNSHMETNQLLEDINKKNQKLFYMTLVIVHFADTKEQLDSDTKFIQGIGRGLLLDVKKLSQQQEQGLNAALPLAVNQLFIKRVLTTENASIFMPFVNQELNDRKGGMYYGNNAVSHNLIMLNRRNAKNGNGFIFGTPGSGKSMSAKQEMMTVLLSSDDTVIVIDPEGEYYPMAELLGGEVIRIAAGADVHINPFDIDMDSESDDDPMAIKSDFIVSLCETAVAGQYGLAPTQRSLIDRCVRMAYEDYLNSYDPNTGLYDKSKIPTLKTFYNLLRSQSGYDAMQLADGLEIYVDGSMNLFAHRTNVEYKKRFVVFDIKDVGSTMKPMALLVVLDNIWNRIVAGRKEARYTWFFIDEIYLLFKTQSSAEFLRNLYKRARKYYGLPTGITQNVSDLLEDDTARTMISNCEYIQMLNQAPLDRVQLAELLNISDTQLGFVTNANPGEGLIYDGRVIVPFVNKLPKDTKQYEAMTTKPDEVKERERKKKEREALAAQQSDPA